MVVYNKVDNSLANSLASALRVHGIEPVMCDVKDLTSPLEERSTLSILFLCE